MGDFLSDLRDRFQDWVEDLEFTSLHRRSLAIIFGVVIALSVVIVVRGHSTPVVEPSPVVVAPVKIVVDVAGEVASPGIYSLEANSRVADAIDAAGGAKKGADLSQINLARVIKDGEQIYVDVLESTNPPPGQRAQVSKKRSGPININRATGSEFDSLPGIGPVIASRIVEYRKANGPFAAIEDLQKVSGIGSAKFAQIKSKVRV